MDDAATAVDTPTDDRLSSLVVVLGVDALAYLVPRSLARLVACARAFGQKNGEGRSLCDDAACYFLTTDLSRPLAQCWVAVKILSPINGTSDFLDGVFVKRPTWIRLLDDWSMAARMIQRDFEDSNGPLGPPYPSKSRRWLEYAARRRLHFNFVARNRELKRDAAFYDASNAYAKPRLDAWRRVKHVLGHFGPPLDRLAPLTVVLGVDSFPHLDATSLCRLAACSRAFGRKNEETGRSLCTDVARARLAADERWVAALAGRGLRLGGESWIRLVDDWPKALKLEALGRLDWPMTPEAWILFEAWSRVKLALGISDSTRRILSRGR